MPLLNILLIIVVIGFLLWMVNNYIPMDEKIKKILNIVIVIAVIVWLLNILGLFNTIMNYRV